MIVRIAGIVFFALILGGDLLLAPNLLLPFQPLGERIRLLAYTNFAAIAAVIPLLGGGILVGIHQIFHPRKNAGEYAKAYHSVGMKIFWITLAVVILAIFSRFYLGYKVDQAGYVKCVNESRTSAKSSWRVYAKSESLCKDSSGIYGG
ncbi:DUF1240 domain-containing protein [Vibrio mangrovi]|uniref:DUF1240 domain-containing protein n=1 Tax=Vibrio mangrovi TaxID=474394 RepID=A0A1Y6ITF3_9VIBR|nr:DUF1240 domain-containing protein [Vibrio mangrovi]MDW6001874.1 DUF1240 domain-containing protein [Vibrio mangrovi]SMS00100.1 hypothetical protein VIM7927_01341 [Vibrio mangrovi]